MGPLVGDELAAIRMTLEELVRAEGVSDVVRREVEGIVRKLERIEATWDEILPYLYRDIEIVSGLLGDLSFITSQGLRSSILAVVNEHCVVLEPELVRVSVVNRRHGELRRMLAFVLQSDDWREMDARQEVVARVRAGLKRSLDARPW